MLLIIYLSLIGATVPVQAGNYYWRITAINSNFNNPSNWTDSPTGVGGTSPGTQPTLTDDVFFVGSPSITAISPVGIANVRSLTCTASAAITITNNGDFNIAGNVSLNGKLKITGGYVYLVNNSSPSNATIDLGTSSQTTFGSIFKINKPGYRVDLSSDFNVTGALNNIDASFYSNGKNITVTNLQTGAATLVRTIDFSNSTVTITSATAQNIFYTPKTTYVANNSTFNCNNNYIAIYCSNTETTINFGTLNLLNPVSTTVSTRYTTGGSIANVYATNLNVNSPSVLFKSESGYQYDRLNSLNISGSLNINTKSQVVFDYPQSPYTIACNINAINVVPVGCNNQSAIVAKSPVTLTATGSAISTSNLSYYGITFAGAGVTAPKSDDAGNNSGVITWTADAANNYYWIGGPGNWNDPAHWSLSSGGVAAGCVPKATDNVYVDNNSFSADGQAITMPVSAPCNNIYWTDANRRGSLLVGDASVSLMVGGSADFSGVKTKGVYPNLYFTGSGTITSAIDTTYSSPSIVFQTTGTYTLANDLVSKQNINISRNTCASIQPNSGSWIFHQSGILSAGGHKIVAGRFRSVSLPASATRVLDFKNSQLSLLYNSNNTIDCYALELDKTNLTSYDFSGSDIYLNSVYCPNFNDVYLTTKGGAFVFNNVTFLNTVGTAHFLFSQTGNTFNTVTFNNDFQMSNYGFITDKLYLAPQKTFSFGNSTAYTVEVKTLLDTRADVCNMLTIKNVTLKSGYTPFIITGAKVLNVKASPNALTVNGGIDQGGNTNVTVVPAVARNFYWVGGAGNWSDCSHWSIGVSGGNPAVTNPTCCLPSDLDDVYFDGNSFTTTGEKVTFDLISTNIHSMKWDAAAGAKAPVFYNYSASGFNLNLSGSLEWATGMLLNFPVASAYVDCAFNFTGTDQSANAQYINANGVDASKANYKFSGTGRYDVLSDLNGVFYFKADIGTGCSLYLHGNDIHAQLIYITQTSTNYVDISNSVLDAPQMISVTVANCSYFNSAGADLVGNYPNISNSCPITFNSITLGVSTTCSNTYPVTAHKISTGNASAATYTFNGKFVTDTLRLLGAGTKHVITAGTSITVNDTVISEGTPCNLITLKSSGTSPGYLISPNCNLTLPLFQVQYITGDISAGGASSDCYTVYGSDLGGNSNLKFLAPPSGTINLADTIVACQNLPYIMSLNVLGSPTGYKWYKNGTLIAGATSRNYHINSVGTYKVEVTYSGALCSNIYQQNVTAIIDTIKPTLQVPGNIVMCRSFTNSGTALDPISVTDNCNLNRVWYTLSGATTLGPVKSSTLDGVAFKKGVTTVTWFANDTVPTTWYSGATPTPNVGSASFNVTVVDNVAPVTTDVEYCLDATASALSVPTISGQTAQWYTVATGGTASTTAPTPSTSTTGSTTWYVSYVDDATGCESDRTALVVTVLPAPTAPAIGSITSPTCTVGTGSVSLSGLPVAGNWTVTVSNGFTQSGSGSTTTITGLNPGNYTFSVTNAQGCTSGASAQATVPPQPLTPVVSLAPVGSVCANAPAFALYGSPVGGTYSGTGVTGNTFDPATAGAGAHIISYSYTNSLGCTATASTTATVLAAPDLTLSPASQTICSGTVASLTASGHNGATVTWSANMLLPSGTGTNYTTGVLKNSGILPYTIKLTATAQTGSCVSQAVGSITVLPEPKVTVVPRSAVVCSYETPRFTLSAATSGTTISWQLKNSGGTVLQSGSGAGSITLPSLASGNYTLEVTGMGNGCTSVLNVPLIVN